jgi:hypothetical protein
MRTSPSFSSVAVWPVRPTAVWGGGLEAGNGVGGRGVTAADGIAVGVGVGSGFGETDGLELSVTVAEDDATATGWLWCQAP